MKPKETKSYSVGIRLTEAQKVKLDQLAEQLMLSPNSIIGLLIDNATIEPVVKQEPVARLKVK